MNSILSPRGQSWVEIGGDRCWMQRVKGDICVTFQWLMAGRKEPSPCMVLTPMAVKLDGGAYVIPQENAYEYADILGNPTPHLMVAAFNAAQQMGFFPDQSTVFRIVDIIVDGLPDLIRMPSEQPDDLNLKAPTLGIEATTKVGGQVFRQEVI
jgi:hypothetical protein